MYPLIPVPELIRKLKLHQQHQNLRPIAQMADIDYQGLRKMMRIGKMSVRMQTLLSEIMQRLDRGDITYRRNVPKLANGENVNKTLVEQRPPDAPYQQRRIVRAAEYSRWARCIACGGTHFSGISRTGHRYDFTYYACDDCVDTPERIMMGDKQRE